MKEPRVLVLGSQGMLGQAVARLLAERGCRVTGTQFADPAGPNYLDAASGRGSWNRVFRDTGCEYVVNCIGMLSAAVKESDARSMELAIRINSVFPYEVAAAAAEQGTKVIHISTDGVFAGREEPYRETDPPDCMDHYGRSKALGECPAANVLNIRCSIIGRDPAEHKGLLEWYLRQPEGSEVDGYAGQKWNGVTTVQLASLCARIIESGKFDSIRAESGVHHFCPNPATTKYDLLRAWQAVSGRRVNVRPVPSPAPANRVLASIHRSLPAFYAPRSGWREILSELEID